MALANAHDTISRIAASLFSAEERRLEKLREMLIVQNKECYLGHPHDGFTYKGECYDPAGLPRAVSQVVVHRGKRVRIPSPPITRTRVSLHTSLTGDMDDYLRDLEQVWSDRHRISQMLYSLLQPCKSTQDIRDALPNCIVDTQPDLKAIPRQQEEAFTIKTNPMLLKQYLRILPRMEFYSIARLVY